MCPREQFCNEKGATYFAHPILHCRLSLVKEQTNGARLSTTDGCKIQDADYRICCELLQTQHIHTLILKTNMFSVYVVRIQKCFGHTVSQFCATPELPSEWQYLNQLKSLPNFIPTLSRFQIHTNWLFSGLSLVFLVSGASNEASYETLFALVLFDSTRSDSKVYQN